MDAKELVNVLASSQTMSEEVADTQRLLVTDLMEELFEFVDKQVVDLDINGSTPDEEEFSRLNGRVIQARKVYAFLEGIIEETSRQIEHVLEVADDGSIPEA